MCCINQVFNSILWNSNWPNHFPFTHLVSVGIYSSKQNQRDESSHHYSSSWRRSTEWVFNSCTEEESHSHRKDPKHETKKHNFCFHCDGFIKAIFLLWLSVELIYNDTQQRIQKLLWSSIYVHRVQGLRSSFFEKINHNAPAITLKARNTQNHKFNFDIAFQIQEQKQQKFKIFQANNRVWPKFESKKKQIDQK